MWNFLECIRKGAEFARLIKKDTYFRGPLFWALYFQGCYTLLWNYTCNELRFFQNFQGKPRNFGGVFTNAVPKPPCLFVSGTKH